MIAKFFHRLWHYHCEECIQEEHEARVCASCETLRQMLAQVTQEKQMLMGALIKQNEPIQETPAPQMAQLQPRAVPWAIRKQMLEQADREKAEVLRRHSATSQTTEELEKELGVSDATQ